MLAHSSLQIIPREECLRLLGGQSVGRLGFVSGDQPIIVPVNYAAVNGVVVFRSGEGTKADLPPLAKVAFEVDHLDHGERTGWSVVVQGVLEDVTGDPGWFLQPLYQGTPRSWAPGTMDRYLRIIPRVVSGRRILGSEG